MSRRSRRQADKWKSKPYVAYTLNCKCGKLGYFTRKDAREEVKRNPRLKSIYLCTQSNTYHTTKMDDSEHPGVDLPTGVKLHKDIENYLWSLWTTDKVFKISSSRVTHKFPEQKPQTVYAALSQMKKSGTLMNLDEKVPDQKGAKYFALTKVIDEMTKADKDDTMAHVPNQSSTPVAESSEILTKLNGLVNGYTEITNKLNKLTESPIGTSQTIQNIDERLEKVLEKRRIDPHYIADLLGKIVELKFNDIASALTQPIVSEDSYDYKRGLRDGIKLAVDMGIMLPNGGSNDSVTGDPTRP